jgi:hypothetical protein
MALAVHAHFHARFWRSHQSRGLLAETIVCTSAAALPRPASTRSAISTPVRQLAQHRRFVVPSRRRRPNAGRLTFAGSTRMLCAN